MVGFDPMSDSHLRRGLLDKAQQQASVLSKKVPLDESWYVTQIPDWSGKLPAGHAYLHFAPKGRKYNLWLPNAFEKSNLKFHIPNPKLSS